MADFLYCTVVMFEFPWKLYFLWNFRGAGIIWGGELLEVIRYVITQTVYFDWTCWNCVLLLFSFDYCTQFKLKRESIEKIQAFILSILLFSTKSRKKKIQKMKMMKMMITLCQRKKMMLLTIPLPVRFKCL